MKTYITRHWKNSFTAISAIAAVMFLAAFLTAGTARAQDPFSGNPVAKIAEDLSPAVVNIDVEAILSCRFRFRLEVRQCRDVDVPKLGFEDDLVSVVGSVGVWTSVRGRSRNDVFVDVFVSEYDELSFGQYFRYLCSVFDKGAAFFKSDHIYGVMFIKVSHEIAHRFVKVRRLTEEGQRPVLYEQGVFKKRGKIFQHMVNKGHYGYLLYGGREITGYSGRSQFVVHGLMQPENVRKVHFAPAFAASDSEENIQIVRPKIESAFTVRTPCQMPLF